MEFVCSWYHTPHMAAIERSRVELDVPSGVEEVFTERWAPLIDRAKKESLLSDDELLALRIRHHVLDICVILWRIFREGQDPGEFMHLSPQIETASGALKKLGVKPANDPSEQYIAGNKDYLTAARDASAKTPAMVAATSQERIVIAKQAQLLLLGLAVNLGGPLFHGESTS